MCASALCPFAVPSKELLLQTLAVERHPDQAWQRVADLQRAGFDAEIAAKVKPRQPKQVECALQQPSCRLQSARQQACPSANWFTLQAVLPPPMNPESVH